MTPQSDITGAAVSGAKSDEIERLRARVAELEAGLRKIADAPAWGAPDRWEITPFEVRQLARALLKGADE